MFDKENKKLIFKASNDERAEFYDEWDQWNYDDELHFIFREELKHDLRYGYKFNDFQFIDHEQNSVECTYNLVFYRKIKNGQFMQKSIDQE